MKAGIFTEFMLEDPRLREDDIKPNTMNILDQLNPQQKEAVTTTEGPLLVLAGAGSGKTKVLTHRIAYILEQNLAQDNEILAVTFTNKAAKELQGRIERLLKNQKRGISWCGTFHSVCLRILKAEGEVLGIDRNFTIYDSTDSLDAIKEAMDTLQIDKKDTNPRAIKSAISSAKNELVTPNQFADFADGYFQEIVAKVYPVYQNILRRNNSLDFDDLIMLVTQLFESSPQILAKYKRIFKYILVDEYQDTNRAQYMLIRQLTDKNICVVGDDDQSIYKFRGADISNILNFEKDFPDTTIIKLEQNYRSTQTILDASHAIVKRNEKRREKKLWTEKGSGNAVRIHTATDERDEGAWVSQQIQDQSITTQRYSDIVVLYRTNAQSRVMEESLIRQGIPYRIVGGVRFYDRREVKDILAYMRIIQNHKDELSLKRIINRPRRGLGKKTVEVLINTARELDQSAVQYLINENESVLNAKLKNFSNILVKLISQISELKLSEFIKLVIEETGYFDYLNDGTNEGQGRLENLNELVSMSSEYDLPTEDFDTQADEHASAKQTLEKFLEDVSLLEESQRNQEENEDSVTLMTIHASKGLEFHTVFIIGMEEMLFPHSRSYSDPKEMEEERRLAYVALTRAKQQIFAIHAETRRQYGKVSSNPPSRFLEDIPKKLIEYSSDNIQINSDKIFEDFYEEEETESPSLKAKTGELVKHEVFGIGELLAIDDSVVKIKFPLPIGTKELSIEYAKLERV